MIIIISPIYVSMLLQDYKCIFNSNYTVFKKKKTPQMNYILRCSIAYKKKNNTKIYTLTSKGLQTLPICIPNLDSFVIRPRTNMPVGKDSYTVNTTSVTIESDTFNTTKRREFLHQIDQFRREIARIPCMVP